MASLHAAAALAAVTHSDIKTAHDSPPHDLFLILGFATLQPHAAAAMRDSSSTRAGMGRHACWP